MHTSTNRDWLLQQYPNAFQFFEEWVGEEDPNRLEIVTSKNGMPNAVYLNDAQRIFTHSAYDPAREAKMLIDQHAAEIQDGKHLVLIGGGFFYHVKEVAERFPEVTYSVFEPDLLMFQAAIQQIDFSAFVNPKRLIHLFFGEEIEVYQRILLQKNKPLVFIVHPYIERCYATWLERFWELMRLQTRNKTANLKANTLYEKLWVINSQLNFHHVCQTPPIQSLKHIFKGKPVLMVAAGPSLQDEMEHIRQIKANRSAYIFTVGSANRALIQNGIMPDAVFSYDPNLYNHHVFQEIIDQGIDTIPLVFGSTIGFETLEKYPGPKLHMITNQDVVSKFALDPQFFQSSVELLSDATTIAILTLELLVKLEFSTIILVGQNFAFRDQQYYTSGIEYEKRSNLLNKAEQLQLVPTPGVYGEDVFSSAKMIHSKTIMERLIEGYAAKNVINTTNGGAHIEGTVFKRLETVIADQLQETIVVADWHTLSERQPNLESIMYHVFALKEGREKLPKLVDELSQLLIRLHRLVEYGRKDSDLLKVMMLIESKNEEIYANPYYRVLVTEMIRVNYSILKEKSLEIQKMKSRTDQAQAIVENYGLFLEKCIEVVQDNEPIIQEMIDHMEEIHRNRVSKASISEEAIIHE